LFATVEVITKLSYNQQNLSDELCEATSLRQAFSSFNPDTVLRLDERYLTTLFALSRGGTIQLTTLERDQPGCIAKIIFEREVLH
jgi:hypothetical protein